MCQLLTPWCASTEVYASSVMSQVHFENKVFSGRILVSMKVLPQVSQCSKNSTSDFQRGIIVCVCVCACTCVCVCVCVNVYVCVHVCDL